MDEPELISAVRAGDLAEVRRLLNAGAEVNLPINPRAAEHLGLDPDTLVSYPLLCATQQGPLSMVDVLIAAGAAPDSCSVDGTSALMFLVRGWGWRGEPPASADLEVSVARLIEAGADVSAASKLGETPLIQAVRAGSEPIVERLLKSGADPNQVVPGGRSAATEAGSAALVKLLVAHGLKAETARPAAWNAMSHHNFAVGKALLQPLPPGERKERLVGARLAEAGWLGKMDDLAEILGGKIDPGTVKEYGGLAMAMALDSRSPDRCAEIVAILLDAGADPNGARWGRSCLYHAVNRRLTEAIDLLLGAGADPNAESQVVAPLMAAVGAEDLQNERKAPATTFDRQVDELVEKLLAHGADVNAMAESYGTALLIALERHPRNVERLLEAGADPDLPSGSGYLPLMAADTSNTRLLLATGANAGAQGFKGNTPLHGCASTTKADLLRRAGADVGARNDDGETPLLTQAQAGNFAVVKWLHKYPEARGGIDNSGRSAVLAAALHPHMEIVHFLIERGEDPLVVPTTGQTLLLLASRSRETELLRLALELGCRINHQDPQGNTALMYAAGGGYVEHLRTLLEHGADTTLQDERGRTALQRAILFNRPETAALLR